MNIKLLSFTILFICTSCSITNKNMREIDYDESIESSLSTIESSDEIESPFQKRRREAIIRYKLMREAKAKRRKRSYTPRRITYKAVKKKRIKKKRIIHANPEELSIEINQKLTYFCMKSRKRNSFQQNGSCEVFIKSRLDKCNMKFDRDDRNLLYCVEKSIR